MSRSRARHLAALGIALVFASAGARAQIQLGLLDDFEGAASTCDADNWTEGFASPNPPNAVLGCGELSTCCLEADSSGGFGSGSRQVIFNETQWIGDYVAAGVNKIQMQVANASATEMLNVRVGVTNGTSCYVSTDPVELAPGMPGPGGLVPASFLLDDTRMTSVTGNVCSPGGDSLQTVLSNVTQLRILSSATPAWQGDAIASTLQVDAIQSTSDSDLDGVNDDVDNCVDVANPAQRDTDGDGDGNFCDADLNNDCIVNIVDLGIFKSVFFTADPDADFDGNGQVNVSDLSIIGGLFFEKPGPGLGTCRACVPPAAIGSNDDFAGVPMFMRGGLVLDWGAVPAVNGFSDQTGGLYVAQFEVNGGSFEWKIANEGWSIEYCTTTNLVENTTTAAPLFGCAFPANGTIDIPAPGCYEFQMQTDGNIPPNSVDISFEGVD